MNDTFIIYDTCELCEEFNTLTACREHGCSTIYVCETCQEEHDYWPV